MTHVPIAVVVVSHDTCDDALACLASLDVAGADEVVLVDTGSTDGTVAAVRARHPHVRVLPLANAGFGRGANAGVRATTAPTVVVANADVRFAPDSLAHLAAALADHPSIAAVGPTVRYPDGTLQASARRLPDGTSIIGHALLGRLYPDNRWTRRYRDLDADLTRARDVDWLSGCALALRRTAFDAVDGFDPGYLLYAEDLDLGVRLRAAGWRLTTEPRAEVVHRVGASTSARRGWALVTHARSLDRFHARHLTTSWSARASRPLVRVGLVAWVALTYLWERTLGRHRSTTGERMGGST